MNKPVDMVSVPGSLPGTEHNPDTARKPRPYYKPGRKAVKQSKMKKTTDSRDIAFKATSWPSNPIPFLNRMKELAMEGNDESLEYKANLLIILGQVFGQLATIDVPILWDELYNKLE